MEKLGDTVREERWRWIGHVLGRDSENIGQRILEMELTENRRRGRPQRRFVDMVKEDMEIVDVKREEAGDKVR